MLRREFLTSLAIPLLGLVEKEFEFKHFMTTNGPKVVERDMSKILSMERMYKEGWVLNGDGYYYRPARYPCPGQLVVFSDKSIYHFNTQKLSKEQIDKIESMSTREVCKLARIPEPKGYGTKCDIQLFDAKFHLVSIIRL